MSERSKTLILQLAIGANLFVTILPQAAGYAQSVGDSKATGQVSMSILPVQQGTEGQQFIVTKAGYTVSIPGLGIAPDAKEVAVFKDQANNYWYVDRKGTTQKVSAEQLQWTLAQINQQQAAKGMPVTSEMPSQMVSPTQEAIAQTTPNVIVQNTLPGGQNAYSTNGANAMMSGAAAMGGAMAGSAIGASMYNNNNGYHGIPYGAPCYSEGGQRYYMRANGARVPIAADSNNAYLNQWDNQRPYQNNNVNGMDNANAQMDIRRGENDVNRIRRLLR